MQTNSTMLTPTFRVTIDGKDITTNLRPALSRMTLALSRKDHADQLDLEFADTDESIALPRKGAALSVMIGFEGSGVCQQGSFVVDEVEHRGTPDVIHVRGRSARVSAGLATRKERSWSNTTIGHIVNMIAGENALAPRVSAKLASQAVTQVDQTESDMALLRRLGKQWDAVATVKSGCLIFAPIGHTQTVSGKPLEVLNLKRADGDGHHYQEIDRSAYTGVRARWHDVAAARGHTALAGKNGHVKIIRGDYASEEDAKRAAAAEFARVQRGACSFDLDLAIGQPDAYPERPVKLSGWKPEICAVDWIIDTATHQLDGNGGYTTTLRLENKAAADDHAAVIENSDEDADESGSEEP
jgi:phage protein D